MLHTENYIDTLWFEPSTYEVWSSLPTDYQFEVWYFNSPHSLELLKEFRIMLCEQIFNRWNINPIVTKELADTQAKIMGKNWIMEYYQKSIPIRQIHTYIWTPKDVKETIFWIGASASLFHRHMDKSHSEEVALNSHLFRRLNIEGFKKQLMRILDWEIMIIEDKKNTYNVYLDNRSFCRTSLQELWIEKVDLDDSFIKQMLIDVTKNRLGQLWCTHKYLHNITH